MINCEHLIVQRVVSLLTDKLTRRLCKEYVGRRAKKAPGVNLRRDFAFACTFSFSPKVITWLEPAIQSKKKIKNSPWSAVNFRKHVSSISSKPEPAIWSRNTGQRIACFDSCQLTWIPKIKDIAMVIVLLSYFSRYWRTDERTDSHVTTKFFSDRWVTKFSKV